MFDKLADLINEVGDLIELLKSLSNEDEFK